MYIYIYIYIVLAQKGVIIDQLNESVIKYMTSSS